MFKKIISIIILSCFTFSFILNDALHAVVETSGVSGRLSSTVFDGLVIPSSVGRITEARYYGSEKVVINIQDLHCHPEVQRNISRMLEIFDRKYKLKRVYVEGASGAVDTSWLSNISDKQLRKELVETLVGQGKLTGTEHYSIVSGRPGLLKGLEEEKLYKDNLLRLNRVLEKKEKYADLTKLLYGELEGIQKKYFHQKNIKFNRILRKYREGKIETAKFYKVLKKYVETINKKANAERDVSYIDLSSYVNMIGYIELLDIGKKLQYKRIARQLQILISILKQKLPYNAYNTLLERTNNFTKLDELYVYLPEIVREKNIALGRKYPDLKNFFSYLEKGRGINPLELIKEEKKLISDVRAALSEDEGEKEVVFLTGLLGYFDDYLNNRISAEDYQYFTGRIFKFKLLWAKHSAKNGLQELESDFKLLDEYYRANLERNNCFIKNILPGKESKAGVVKYSPFIDNKSKTVDSLKKADEIIITVSGGFHTKGIENILNEKEISYISITPNVTSDTKNSDIVYIELAKQQAKILSQALAPMLASLFAKMAEGKNLTDEQIRAKQLVLAEVLGALTANCEKKNMEMGEREAREMIGSIKCLSELKVKIMDADKAKGTPRMILCYGGDIKDTLVFELDEKGKLKLVETRNGQETVVEDENRDEGKGELVKAGELGAALGFRSAFDTLMIANVLLNLAASPEAVFALSAEIKKASGSAKDGLIYELEKLSEKQSSLNGSTLFEIRNNELYVNPELMSYLDKALQELLWLHAKNHLKTIEELKSKNDLVKGILSSNPWLEEVILSLQKTLTRETVSNKDFEVPMGTIETIVPNVNDNEAIKELINSFSNPKNKAKIESMLFDITNRKIRNEDLQSNIDVEFYAEGSNKRVYKVTIYTKDELIINIAVAVKIEKESDKIEQNELQDLEWLSTKKRRGLNLTPILGFSYRTSSGKEMYVEEFIEGLNAKDYEIQKQAKLTVPIKKKILHTLFSVGLLLGNFYPKDVHNANFMFKNDNSVVMVDIGSKRFQMSPTNKSLNSLMEFMFTLFMYYSEPSGENDNRFIIDSLNDSAIIVEDYLLKHNIGTLRKHQTIESAKEDIADYLERLHEYALTMTDDQKAHFKKVVKNNVYVHSYIDNMDEQTRDRFIEEILDRIRVATERAMGSRAPPEQVNRSEVFAENKDLTGKKISAIEAAFAGLVMLSIGLGLGAVFGDLIGLSAIQTFSNILYVPAGLLGMVAGFAWFSGLTSWISKIFGIRAGPIKLDVKRSSILRLAVPDESTIFFEVKDRTLKANPFVYNFLSKLPVVVQKIILYGTGIAGHEYYHLLHPGQGKFEAEVKAYSFTQILPVFTGALVLGGAAIIAGVVGWPAFTAGAIGALIAIISVNYRLENKYKISEQDKLVNELRKLEEVPINPLVFETVLPDSYEKTVYKSYEIFKLNNGNKVILKYKTLPLNALGSRAAYLMACKLGFKEISPAQIYLGDRGFIGDIEEHFGEQPALFIPKYDLTEIENALNIVLSKKYDKYLDGYKMFFNTFGKAGIEGDIWRVFSNYPRDSHYLLYEKAHNIRIKKENGKYIMRGIDYGYAFYQDEDYVSDSKYIEAYLKKHQEYFLKHGLNIFTRIVYLSDEEINEVAESVYGEETRAILERQLNEMRQQKEYEFGTIGYSLENMDKWKSDFIKTAKKRRDSFKKVYKWMEKENPDEFEKQFSMLSSLKTEDSVLDVITEEAVVSGEVLQKKEDNRQGGNILAVDPGTVEGFMAKLYDSDDPESRKMVKRGFAAKEVRQSTIIEFMTKDHNTLYTKDGIPAKVEKTGEMISPDVVFENENRIDNLANFHPGFAEFIDNFKYNGEIHIIKDNPNVSGFYKQDGFIKKVFLSKKMKGNPIAIFHELGEGYFALHPEELPVGVNAHTYLRGCGKEVRNLAKKYEKEWSNAEELIEILKKNISEERKEGINQAEFDLIEKNAADGYKDYDLLTGLQEKVFGPHGGMFVDEMVELIAAREDLILEEQVKELLNRIETGDMAKARLELRKLGPAAVPILLDIFKDDETGDPLRLWHITRALLATRDISIIQSLQELYFNTEDKKKKKEILETLASAITDSDSINIRGSERQAIYKKSRVDRLESAGKKIIEIIEQKNSSPVTVVDLCSSDGVSMLSALKNAQSEYKNVKFINMDLSMMLFKVTDSEGNFAVLDSKGDLLRFYDKDNKNNPWWVREPNGWDPSTGPGKDIEQRFMNLQKSMMGKLEKEIVVTGKGIVRNRFSDGGKTIEAIHFISPQAIEWAMNHDVEFIQGDIYNSKEIFGEKSVDIAVAGNLLGSSWEYFNRDETLEAIRKAGAILKEKGKIIVGNNYTAENNMEDFGFHIYERRGNKLILLEAETKGYPGIWEDETVEEIYLDASDSETNGKNEDKLIEKSSGKTRKKGFSGNIILSIFTLLGLWMRNDKSDSAPASEFSVGFQNKLLIETVIKNDDSAQGDIESNVIKGFMAKLYDSDDPEVRKIVKENYRAVEKKRSKYISFYDRDGKILYNKDRKPARVEKKELLYKLNKSFVDSKFNILNSLYPGFMSFIKDFIVNGEIQGIRENPYVTGFFINSDKYPAGKIYMSEKYVDNSIAVFHELGEAYFALHPEELPEGVNAHTYLRGCGKDVRNLISKNEKQYTSKELIEYLKKNLPERINDSELNLISFNSDEGLKMSCSDMIMGLQETIFGSEGGTFLDEIEETPEVDLSLPESIEKLLEVKLEGPVSRFAVWIDSILDQSDLIMDEDKLDLLGEQLGISKNVISLTKKKSKKRAAHSVEFIKSLPSNDEKYNLFLLRDSFSLYSAFRLKNGPDNAGTFYLSKALFGMLVDARSNTVIQQIIEQAAIGMGIDYFEGIERQRGVRLTKGIIPEGKLKDFKERFTAQLKFELLEGKNRSKLRAAASYLLSYLDLEKLEKTNGIRFIDSTKTGSLVLFLESLLKLPLREMGLASEDFRKEVDSYMFYSQLSSELGFTNDTNAGSEVEEKLYPVEFKNNREFIDTETGEPIVYETTGEEKKQFLFFMILLRNDILRNLSQSAGESETKSYTKSDTKESAEINIISPGKESASDLVETGKLASQAANPLAVLKAAQDVIQNTNGAKEYLAGQEMLSEISGSTVYHVFTGDEKPVDARMAAGNATGINNVGITLLTVANSRADLVKIEKVLIPVSGQETPELVQIWAGAKNGNNGESAVTLYLEPLNHPELAGINLEEEMKLRQMMLLGFGSRETIRFLAGSSYAKDRLNNFYSNNGVFQGINIEKMRLNPGVVVLNGEMTVFANARFVEEDSIKDLLFKNTIYAYMPEAGEREALSGGKKISIEYVNEDNKKQKTSLNFGAVKKMCDLTLDKEGDFDRSLSLFNSHSVIQNAESRIRRSGLIIRMIVPQLTAAHSNRDSGTVGKLLYLQDKLRWVKEMGGDTVLLEKLFSEKGQSLINNDLIDINDHYKKKLKDLSGIKGKQSLRFEDEKQKIGYLQLKDVLDSAHREGMKVYREFIVDNSSENNLEQSRDNIVFWLKSGINGTVFDGARVDLSSEKDIDIELFKNWASSLRREAGPEAGLTFLLPSLAAEKIKNICESLNIKVVKRYIAGENMEALAEENECMEMHISDEGMYIDDLKLKDLIERLRKVSSGLVSIPLQLLEGGEVSEDPRHRKKQSMRAITHGYAAEVLKILNIKPPMSPVKMYEYEKKIAWNLESSHIPVKNSALWKQFKEIVQMYAFGESLPGIIESKTEFSEKELAEFFSQVNLVKDSVVREYPAASMYIEEMLGRCRDAKLPELQKEYVIRIKGFVEALAERMLVFENMKINNKSEFSAKKQEILFGKLLLRGEIEADKLVSAEIEIHQYAGLVNILLALRRDAEALGTLTKFSEKFESKVRAAFKGENGTTDYEGIKQALQYISLVHSYSEKTGNKMKDSREKALIVVAESILENLPEINLPDIAGMKTFYYTALRSMAELLKDKRYMEYLKLEKELINSVVEGELGEDSELIKANLASMFMYGEISNEISSPIINKALEKLMLLNTDSVSLSFNGLLSVLDLYSDRKIPGLLEELKPITKPQNYMALLGAA